LAFVKRFAKGSWNALGSLGTVRGGGQGVVYSGIDTIECALGSAATIEGGVRWLVFPSRKERSAWVSPSSTHSFGATPHPKLRHPPEG